MVVTLLLLFSAVFYRVALAFSAGTDFNGWWNFAPLGALALCGGRFLPGLMGWWLPLGALAASDILLNVWVYGVPIWGWELAPRYGAFLLAGLLGRLQARREPDSASFGSLLSGALAASFIFYGLTNTASWLLDPGYPKTAEGWVQALTTGLPGYPSTLWFYKNTLLSDMAFTLLLGVLMRFPGILTNLGIAAAGFPRRRFGRLSGPAQASGGCAKKG